MRKMIITCDDCGMSEGINLATLELHQRGWTVAPSVMMNFTASRHALNLFAAHPSMKIGVHLNLTDGFPVLNAPVPSQLVGKDGRFRGRFALWRRATWPSPDFLEQTRAELTAQVECFVQFGFCPEHITTHTHFHMFPTLRRMVEQLAEDFGVPWIRAHRLQSTVLPFTPIPLVNRVFPAHDERFEATALPPSLRANAGDEESCAARTRLGVNTLPAGTRLDFLVPIKNWLNRPPSELSHKLDALDGTVEIVVHPCTEQDDTFPPNIDYAPRERHREMLYLLQVMAQQ